MVKYDMKIYENDAYRTHIHGEKLLGTWWFRFCVCAMPAATISSLNRSINTSNRKFEYGCKLYMEYTSVSVISGTPTFY